jgi:hypothetical protein
LTLRSRRGAKSRREEWPRPLVEPSNRHLSRRAHAAGRSPHAVAGLRGRTSHSPKGHGPRIPSTFRHTRSGVPAQLEPHLFSTPLPHDHDTQNSNAWCVLHTPTDDRRQMPHAKSVKTQSHSGSRRTQATQTAKHLFDEFRTENRYMKQQTTGYSRHNEGGTRTKPIKDTVTPYGRAGSLSHDSQCQFIQERGASERPYSHVAREHGPYTTSENGRRGTNHASPSGWNYTRHAV